MIVYSTGSRYIIQLDRPRTVPRTKDLQETMSEKEHTELASDAYVYFYPIVQNLKTLFHVSIWPHSESFTPLNKFKHVSSLVDWKFSGVVSPNNDTLYSRAWLDLDKSPMILMLPKVPVMQNGKKVSRYVPYRCTTIVRQCNRMAGCTMGQLVGTQI